MIGLLVVIAIVLLGVLARHAISGIVDNVETISMSEVKTACPPHDWWELQDEQGNEFGLICIVCSKRPEELQ